MTLNDLEWSYCVKIWFELGINGLAFWLSEKTVREFAELYAYTVSGKIYPSVISAMRLFTGSPKRKCQTNELYSHFSHKSHMLFTDVCKK